MSLKWHVGQWHEVSCSCTLSSIIETIRWGLWSLINFQLSLYSALPLLCHKIMSGNKEIMSDSELTLWGHCYIKLYLTELYFTDLRDILPDLLGFSHSPFPTEQPFGKTIYFPCKLQIKTFNVPGVCWSLVRPMWSFLELTLSRTFYPKASVTANTFHWIGGVLDGNICMRSKNINQCIL